MPKTLAPRIRDCAPPPPPQEGKLQQVIAFSLFGPSTGEGWQSRYGDGALSNALLMPIVFPGWRMWVYHDDTVPHALLASLTKQPHVTLLNMSSRAAQLPNPRSWRFLVASDPRVGRWLLRDIDSRLIARDKAAIDEWIASGRRFSVMRDHPGQAAYPINAGMWGGTRDALPCLSAMMHDQAAGLNAMLDHLKL